MVPFQLDTPDLQMTARLTPWDTECFGFTVAQIDVFTCLNSHITHSDLQSFFQWLDQNDIQFVSCRLPYNRLEESMLLESSGFRFVETALHPYLNLPDPRYQDTDDFSIELATQDDLAIMEDIAAHAFTHGRIHADPRLGTTLGNKRYSRWVRNTLSHPSQQLIKITNKEHDIIALFITEISSDQSMYWHLTTIAPQFQGQGYGWSIWRAMLSRHSQEGMRSVRTTITAGNVPVLNLYSKLGFRFLPPEMTYHWIRDSSR